MILLSQTDFFPLEGDPISKARYKKLDSYVRVIVDSMLVSYVENPSHFHNSVDNLRSVILSVCKTNIRISIPDYRKRKYIELEEKFVVALASTLLDNLLSVTKALG